MENWKELWQQNYRGEKDTKELEDRTKKLTYGSRNDVTYLPWAVVERIFKLQDGTIEIIFNGENSSVDIDRAYIKDEIDENGVVQKKVINSYFVVIKANWQGRSYTERYPLQDSNGRPLSVWTQNDLNKSIQRGKVKAIAIVSGIGYKLYEDGDLQFEQAEETKKQTEETKPVSKTVTPAQKVVKQEPVKQEPVKQEQPNTEEQSKPVKQEQPKVEEQPKKVEQVKETTVVPEQKMNRIELENEIKRLFLTGDSGKTATIRKFLSESGTNKVSELSLEKVNELYHILID